MGVLGKTAESSSEVPSRPSAHPRSPGRPRLSSARRGRPWGANCARDCPLSLV